MTQCRIHRKRLSAYLDGELPNELKAALMDHLASCAACRGELEALEGLGTALEHLEVPAPTPGLAARITAEARRGRSGKLRHLVRSWSMTMSTWQRELKAIGAAAMLILILCLGIFMNTHGWLPGSEVGRTDISIAGSGTEGLEWFAPAPPGSLLFGYLAMAGQTGPGGGTHP